MADIHEEPGREPLFQFTGEELRFLIHVVESLSLHNLEVERMAEYRELRGWVISKLRHYLQVRTGWENMVRQADDDTPF
jgi:hypothetical protein